MHKNQGRQTRGFLTGSAPKLVSLTATLVLVTGSIGSIDAAVPGDGRVSIEASVIKSRGVPAYKAGDNATPNSPNPYLSYLPAGSVPDYAGWRNKLGDEANARREHRALAAFGQAATSKAMIPVNEAEPIDSKGLNDTQSTAEYLAGFGTGVGDDPEADISGDLELRSVAVEFLPLAEDDGDITKASPTGIATDETVFAIGTIGDSPFDDTSISVVNLAAFAEDDGDINLAGATNVIPGESVVIDAEIGDGPHNGAGSGNGDFDFYAVEVTDGQQVQVRVNRQPGETNFDSILALYDGAGVLLDSNDDVNPNGESAIDHTFSVGGGGSATVYYAVGGWFGNDTLEDDLPGDPFDSSTGPGIGSVGFYTFSATLPVRQTGDFDFYSLAVVQGDRITVEVDTSNHGDVLDSIVALFDSSGNLLALNDDDPDPGETGFDSFLGFVAEQTDTYFIAVGGFNGSVFPTGAGSFPADPFDSATGPGAGSKGSYDVIVSLNDIDLDYYSFDLEAGDIIGANLMGAFATVQIIAEDESLLVGSAGDVSALYPVGSPLPGGGGASAAYIVSVPGRYAAAVGFGEGAYTLELRAYRPPQEATGTTQTIFVDFDGASVDTSKWGGSGPSVLSPLASFLPAWGLSAPDEDAVIDAILANIELNLSSDIKFNGANPTFDIEIQNSRDHADPFGGANVSRVIIGGTRGESGLTSIGASESIDIGNFDQSEDSVVLLDLLSAAVGDPNSLNDYAIDPGASIIGLIGVGVGNIASHEVGHLFANFHTDNANEMPDLMDTGGNMAGMLGLGNDGVFGTEDDVGVKFGLDSYDPLENFSGVEDTRDFVAYGLAAGPAPAFSDIAGLPDINSNGFADIAVIVQGGSSHVHIRDGNTHALIVDIDFGDDPVSAMAVIDDISGNGMPEIALAGTQQNGNVRVQVKDSQSGAFVNNIFYGSAYSAVDMAVLTDTNGNGADELAIVGADVLGGVRVQARDALSDQVTSTTYYSNKAVPIDVVTIPDISANGQPEVLMHSQVPASKHSRAQMRDSTSAVFLTNIFFGKVYMPVEFAVIGDVSGDGIADLAQVGRRDDNGGVRIQVKRSDNGTTFSNAFTGADGIPVSIIGIGDANGNTFPDVAMLVEDVDGSAKVIVRDGFDGAFIRNIFAGAVSNPVAITLVEDLDASGDPELAVLGDNGSGIPKVQIKDSILGTAITEIDFP